MENLTKQFVTAFKDLTGNPPFPWQKRLFHTLALNNPPAQLDIPTGLGKTSVIPIWLLAHFLSNPANRPPMRLVYVVNRRTIVDQASTIAASLWNTIKETPSLLELWRNKFDPQWKTKEPDDENPNKLSVSTLRGALADKREWMRYPHRPAIIVGTVDMIGSRLLFDAYRAGKWTKAMHAGLLGQDSLLVHDEAHLSAPFQDLLKWITDQQSDERKSVTCLSPMKLLAMSATGDSKESDVLTLNEEDLALPAVRQRIDAKKRLTLHPLPKGKPSDELVKLASHYAAPDTTPKKIIIFVRQPETAKTIFTQLTEKLKLTSDRIKLLTGTLRGHERDTLVDSHVLQHLLRVKSPTLPLTSTIYLVATSAGEVGADFDADHLLCDLAPLDSLIQRLGRVNRRGEGDAEVHVVVDSKTADKVKPHEVAALNAATWLSRLLRIPNDPNDRLNASPAALRALRESDPPAYVAACSPKPLSIYPHSVTLDAWALTSVQDNWPLASELDDYLHGRSEYEPPRTTLAWRNEITHFFPFNRDDLTNGRINNEYRVPFEKWLDLSPLHPRELVNDKSEKVASLLAAIATRLPAAPLIRIQRRTIYFQTFGEFAGHYDQLDNNRKKHFADSLADQTLILPIEVGGLSHDGSLDERSSASVPDVGDKIEQDIDGSVKTPDRLRIWLKQSEDNRLDRTLISAITQHPPLDFSKTPLTKSNWRDPIARLFKPRMKVVLSQRFEDEDKAVGILALFKPQLIDRNDKFERVLLTAHNDDAGGFAHEFAKRLNLPAECVTAIELAARWHDLGKDREFWQRSIKNKNRDEPLAKSCGRGMNSDALQGYRHEFGSLIDALNPGKKKSGDHLWSTPSSALDDLALHLIAAHHGRGRPIFPEGAFDPDDLTITTFHELLTPAEIARRYARLQRTYGHWGLAYLESLVMCADHAASRGEEPEDTL